MAQRGGKRGKACSCILAIGPNRLESKEFPPRNKKAPGTLGGDPGAFIAEFVFVAAHSGVLTTATILPSGEELSTRILGKFGIIFVLTPAHPGIALPGLNLP